MNAEEPLYYLENLNYSNVAKSVVKHIDIVRSKTMWNDMGFNPHRQNDGRMSGIKREGIFYGFHQADEKNEVNILSLKTGKRITKKPHFIIGMMKHGVDLGEFIFGKKDIIHFKNAYELYYGGKYELALGEIECACSERELEEYIDLRSNIKIKLNDESEVYNLFNKYEFDVDSAVQSERIFDWLNVLIKHGKTDKVANYILTTINMLDNLASGAVFKRIYGNQSAEYYLYVKSCFTKNLHKIFDRDMSAMECSNNNDKMFEVFAELYTGKDMLSIEIIADVYHRWGENKKAENLYLLCLLEAEKANKPRVTTRLTDKIRKIF